MTTATRWAWLVLALTSGCQVRDPAVEYQKDVQRLAQFRTIRDLDPLEKVIQRDSSKWRQRNQRKRLLNEYVTDVSVRRRILEAVPADLVGAPQEGQAELRLVPERKGAQYILGEPVTLRVSLVNTSSRPVSLFALLAPVFGELLMDISNDAKTFKQYLGPDWSLTDVLARERRFRPGEEVTETATILWNRSIPGASDHLSTPFAFMQEGRYWLRARLHDRVPIKPSSAIEIVMKEPAGDDAAVWAIMMGAPDIARCLQDPRIDVPADCKSRLEAILQNYPRSTYARYIHAALQKLAVSGR